MKFDFDSIDVFVVLSLDSKYCLDNGSTFRGYGYENNCPCDADILPERFAFEVNFFKILGNPKNNFLSGNVQLVPTNFFKEMNR